VYIIRLRYLSALAVTNSASVANWSKSRHRAGRDNCLKVWLIKYHEAELF
jgi:hypothetical protein